MGVVLNVFITAILLWFMVKFAFLPGIRGLVKVEEENQVRRVIKGVVLFIFSVLVIFSPLLTYVIVALVRYRIAELIAGSG